MSYHQSSFRPLRFQAQCGCESVGTSVEQFYHRSLGPGTKRNGFDLLGPISPKSLTFITEKKAIHIWVFLKIGVPQNGWFMMENTIKMDDLGYHWFWKHPYIYIYILLKSHFQYWERDISRQKNPFLAPSPDIGSASVLPSFVVFFFGDRWKPRFFGREKHKGNPPNLGWWNITPVKFNIAPENCWLEDEFPFGSKPIFRGRTVKFPGCLAKFFGVFVGLKHLGLAPICCHKKPSKNLQQFLGPRPRLGWAETKTSNSRVVFGPKESLIEVEFQILQGGGSLITSY